MSHRKKHDGDDANPLRFGFGAVSAADAKVNQLLRERVFEGTRLDEIPALSGASVGPSAAAASAVAAVKQQMPAASEESLLEILQWAAKENTGEPKENTYAGLVDALLRAPSATPDGDTYAALLPGAVMGEGEHANNPPMHRRHEITDRLARALVEHRHREELLSGRTGRHRSRRTRRFG